MKNQSPKIILSVDELPPGAVKIHLYSWKNILIPRGSMKKNSIGSYILEKLKNSFEEWTDPKYGDNPDPIELEERLYSNLMNEVYNSWEEFIKTTPVLKNKLKDIKEDEDDFTGIETS